MFVVIVDMELSAALGESLPPSLLALMFVLTDERVAVGDFGLGERGWSRRSTACYEFDAMSNESSTLCSMASPDISMTPTWFNWLSSSCCARGRSSRRACRATKSARRG